MKAGFWTVAAGAALLAACGQQEGANNAAADNVAELPTANVRPPNEAQNSTDAGNISGAVETTGQVENPAENRAQPAPRAPARTARPVPRERPAEQPASKQEPPPAPTPACTPEHAAMGHCKQ